jgi:hypothetical protein
MKDPMATICQVCQEEEPLVSMRGVACCERCLRCFYLPGKAARWPRWRGPRRYRPPAGLVIGRQAGRAPSTATRMAKDMAVYGRTPRRAA